MPEPSTTVFATVSMGTAAAIMAAFPGVDAAVVLGAFSGAIVFVLSADDLSLARKVLFFLPSFGGGLIAADLVARLIATVSPVSADVARGLGAMVAGAIAVKVLRWLIASDINSMLATVLRRPPQ